jgi:hypothetical protein
MRLKYAAIFALICVTLLTVLLVSDFIVSLMNFADGKIDALALFTSGVHLMTAVSMAFFLQVFCRNR